MSQFDTPIKRLFVTATLSVGLLFQNCSTDFLRPIGSPVTGVGPKGSLPFGQAEAGSSANLAQVEVSEAAPKSPALVVAPNSPTTVMVGYNIWFLPEIYSFSKYDPAIAADYIAKQTEDVAQGKIVFRNDYHRITARPAFDPVKGYDSNDPAVIKYHAKLIEEMGGNALVLDLSNCNYAQFSYSPGAKILYRDRLGMVKVVDTVFATLDYLNREGLPGGKLKVIPLLGAQYPCNYLDALTVNDLTAEASALTQEIYNSYSQALRDIKTLEYIKRFEIPNTITDPIEIENKAKEIFATLTAEQKRTRSLDSITRDYTDVMRRGAGEFGDLSAFERGLIYFDEKFKKYPHLAVQFENRPLAQVFHGVFDVPNFSKYTQRQAEELRQRRGVSFTLRNVSGYIESQPGLWSEAPNPLPRTDRLWSWVDRYQSASSLMSLAMNASRSRVESMAVVARSGSTVGFEHDDPFDLRHGRFIAFRNGQTVLEFMSKVAEYNPQFLYVPHWNGFVSHDTGFTVETTSDIEPTAEWGTKVYDAVKNAIRLYRNPSLRVARFANISARTHVEPGRPMIGGIVLSGNTHRIMTRASGPTMGKHGLVGLPDPSLALFRGPELLAVNSSAHELPQWVGRGANKLLNNILPEQRVYNAGYDVDPLEPGITADLAPGAYTVHVNSENSQSGVALWQVVASDTISPTRIANLSARSYVRPTGPAILGFDIVGGKKRVFLKGTGPTLARFGLTGLADTSLTIYKLVNGTFQVVKTVTSWKSELANGFDLAKISADFGNVLDNDGKEAAFAGEFESGTYTVHLDSEDGSSGEAVIEIFEF